MTQKAADPPADIALEQALLGAILVDESAYWRLEAGITDADFYDPLHARIYQTISDRHGRRMGANPLTVASAMKTDPGLAEVGGHRYLASLAEAAPALPPMREFASQLRELAQRRALIRLGEDMAAAAASPPADATGAASAIIEANAEALFELSRGIQSGRGAVSMRDLMADAIGKAEAAMKAPGDVVLTSGLRTVDQELGGVYRSDLTVIGAPPNMGKTAFAQMMALANASGQPFGGGQLVRPHPSLFFSLEMADWQIGMRALAEATDIPSSLMRRGKLHDADIATMWETHRATADRPLWVDGTPALSVAQIRARAMGRRRRHGALSLVVIDHLRFIRAADRRADERDQLQQVTWDLKALAKEMDVAIVVLAHLNRDYNKRSNKRPINSDLYGASAIEQNADAIWFLHSESYYLEREEPPTSDAKARRDWLDACDREAGWMEIFSTKARMDRVGKARVRFEPAFTRFRDPDAHPHNAEQPPDLLAVVDQP